MAAKPRSAKPALNLWVIDTRKAKGMKPPDLAAAVGVAADTVRGWEAGRGISPENLEAVIRVLGDPPAGLTDQPATGDLAAAITLQAKAIGDLVDELRLWRAAEVLDRAGMRTAVEKLSANCSEAIASLGGGR